jgi:hypothetical protein
LALSALVGLLWLQENKTRQQQGNASGQHNQKPSKANDTPTMFTATVIDTNEMNTESSNSGADSKYEQNPKHRNVSDRRLNTYFSGAVAFFAFVQGFVSLLQWDVMKGQNGIMEETVELMQTDQQAKLIFDPPTATELSDGRIEITLTARNVGKTTAYVTQRQISPCESSEFNFDEEFKAIEFETRFLTEHVAYEETIEPDTAMEFGTTVQGIPKGDPFYVFGYIVYRDEFKETTTLRKCFQFKPATGEFRTVGRHTMTDTLLDAIRKSGVLQKPAKTDGEK